MKILSNEQYNLMLNTVRKLKKENKELKDQIDEQAQEIYSLSEDLAALKWDLSPAKKFLDFPNSVPNSEQSSEDKIY